MQCHGCFDRVTCGELFTSDVNTLNSNVAEIIISHTYEQISVANFCFFKLFKNRNFAKFNCSLVSFGI